MEIIIETYKKKGMVGMVKEHLIANVEDDLKQVLEDRIDGMVEGHLEAWEDRYIRKGRKEVREDLYMNHDPSGEIEFVVHELGRELEGDEYDRIVEYFNENVIYEFPDNE